MMRAWLLGVGLLMLFGCSTQPASEVPENYPAPSEASTGVAHNPYVQRAKAEMASGDVEAAMQSYEAALRIEPRSADAWYGKAEAHAQLDQADQALIMSQKGLRYAQTAEQRRAFYRLQARAYRALGQEEKALAAEQASSEDQP